VWLQKQQILPVRFSVLWGVTSATCFGFAGCPVAVLQLRGPGFRWHPAEPSGVAAEHSIQRQPSLVCAPSLLGLPPRAPRFVASEQPQPSPCPSLLCRGVLHPASLGEFGSTWTSRHVLRRQQSSRPGRGGAVACSFLASLKPSEIREALTEVPGDAASLENP